MIQLDDMQLFVEVVKAGGFTRAAENVDVPKSTLSTRINKLEQAIGLRLLNRTTRKVELTEAGRLYYESAVKIIEEAKLVHQQLGDMLANPKGTLRISAAVDFAYYFVAPLLKEFCERYPHIQFEFDVTPRKVDLIAEPFDLALRAGELTDSNLIARLIGTFSGGLYASPEYLAQYGEPKMLAELAQHQCLRFHAGYNHEWRLFRANETKGKEERTISVQGNIFANSLGMMQTLASQGLGIAVLPDLLAKRSVDAGQLKRILPDWFSQPASVYAVTATRQLPAKVQVFIDFLKEKLG